MKSYVAKKGRGYLRKSKDWESRSPHEVGNGGWMGAGGQRRGTEKKLERSPQDGFASMIRLCKF